MADDVVTTVGAAREYADLKLCAAARILAGADLVARDVREIWECYDDGAPVSSTDLALFGWTTDAEHYVWIRAAEGHQHDGTTRIGDATGNGAWLSSVGYAPNIQMTEIWNSYHRVSGLRFWQDAAAPRGGMLLTDENVPTVGVIVENVLMHGDVAVGSYFRVAFSGAPLEWTLRGCISIGVGAGIALSSTNITFPATMNVINCWFDNYGVSFSLIELTGPGTPVLNIINTVSTNVSSVHWQEVLGTFTRTGYANAQDATGGAELLPDDDPSFPSFDDLEIVVDPASPAAPPGIILLSALNDDVRSKPVADNALFQNGAIEAIMNGTFDIDGTEREVSTRHIGPYVLRAPIPVCHEATVVAATSPVSAGSGNTALLGSGNPVTVKDGQDAAIKTC